MHNYRAYFMMDTNNVYFVCDLSADDQKERERQLLKAEMIPTAPTVLTFWQKFMELQSKMLWHVEQTQSHMYGSEPLEWPLMSKGIAYWVDKHSNVSIKYSDRILYLDKRRLIS